jgi:hypothetical protein
MNWCTLLVTKMAMKNVTHPPPVQFFSPQIESSSIVFWYGLTIIFIRSSLTDHATAKQGQGRVD